MTTVAPPRPGRLTGKLADLGMVALCLAIATILLVGTFTMHVRGQQVPGPTFFPLLVSGLLYVVGAVLLFLVLRVREPERSLTPNVSEDMLHDLAPSAPSVQGGATAAADVAPDADVEQSQPLDWKTVGLVVAGVLFLVLTLEPLGWILSATVLFWVVAYAFGSRRYLFDAGLALLVASAVQLLFSAGLGLALPSGFVGRIF